MKEFNGLWQKPEKEDKKFHGILKFENNNLKLIIEDYNQKQKDLFEEKNMIFCQKNLFSSWL